jgi:hypothetical protein
LQTHRDCQLRSLAVAVFFCGTSVLRAQTSATIGVGGSIVEYDGFLTSAAATLTPALHFESANFSLGGQGSWTVFESGNQIFQATTAAGWLTGSHERWRVELGAAGGASKYADESPSGHALARTRLHFFGERLGGWLGASAGASFDSTTVTPLELSVGAWTIQKGITLVAAVSTTWLGDDRHLDITGAARFTGKRAELEARMGARPWVQSGGDVGEALTGVWGEVSALIPLTAQISFALSGGGYPSDPARRVLGANYLTAGFRVALLGGQPAQLLVMPATIAARTAGDTGDAAHTRLEIARAEGTRYTLRLHVTGASSVDLMADFTDWQPVSLASVSDSIWEIRHELEPGVYRLNIRVDGGQWLVPNGARPEQDEFGGVVGVVVIR